MVELKDLWIGDEVRLKKSQRVGKFEGIHKNGKARILIDNKIVLSTASNLSLLTEDEIQDLSPTSSDLNLEEETIQSPIVTSNDSYHSEPEMLDLHLETLNPLFTESPALSVLEYQLKCCEDFIHRSISDKKFMVRIIHGKGKGILKKEVEAMVNSHPQILISTPSMDGGALELIFSY